MLHNLHVKYTGLVYRFRWVHKNVKLPSGITMIDARVFDEIAESLGKLLPPGVADMKADFESNAKSAVQSALGNLDVVTREEFDVQKAVLAKTREKLKMLETELKNLQVK